MKKLLIPICLLLAMPAIQAQWSNIHDNQPVAYLDGHQHAQRVIADHNGGCYVIWQDARDRINIDQIYAQHFDSLGNPQWAIDGIPLAPTGFLQNRMQAIPDGQGGAFIIWRDLRDSIGPFSTNVDIWGQRIDSTGLLWGPTGKGLILEPGEQGDPLLIPDGAGGFIFSFEDDGDFQSGRTKGYWMQRCDANGNPLWSIGGELVHQVSQVFSSSVDLALTADGQNGGILVWNEFSFNVTDGNNIYGHRMDAGGNRHWPPDLDTFTTIVRERGYPICTAKDHQSNPIARTDASGNIFICWQDSRNPSWQFGALFAQKLKADGTWQWDSMGSQVSSASMGGNNQFDLMPDGLGNVYFNYRNAGDDRVLVKIDQNGQRSWPAPVNIVGNNVVMISPMVKSNTGGVAVAWLASNINPGSEDGVEAQIFDNAGMPLVSGNILLSAYPEDKGPVHIDLGQQDDIFAAWMDWRRTNGQGGANADADLFAQRWTPTTTVGMADVPSPQTLDFLLTTEPGRVRIQLKQQPETDGIIYITNMIGHVLKQVSFTTDNSTILLPFDDWDSGMYLLTVYSNDQSITKRFFRP